MKEKKEEYNMRSRKRKRKIREERGRKIELE